MTRTDYMNGTLDFQTYYTAIADAIGRKAIDRVVLGIAPIETIAECLQADPNLNNIPLYKWDRQDDIVRHLIAQRSAPVMAISWNGQALKPKTFCWSLSETVCVLKAAAKRLVQETR